MIRDIWLRIALLLALAVMPILLIQLRLQEESLSLVYDLADRTGIRDSIDQHLGLLREEARLHPESEADYKQAFLKLTETKKSLEAFFFAKDSILRDFLSQTIAITLSVLTLFLLGSFAISRSIVKRVQVLIDEREKAAFKLRELQALESWQKVAKVLVHELRAPMTPIKLVATDLCHQYQRMSPEKFETYLQGAQKLMNDEVKAIETMIESFTAFAKLPNPEFKDASLTDFLQDFAKVYQNSFGEKVRLVLELDEGPSLASFDPKLLRDLFYNLCKNAAEANLFETRITLRWKKLSDAHVIILHNTGRPIPKALSQSLFDPYVSTKTGSNLGLGLAISRKIAFDHGGDLVLEESSETNGVSFRLELPLIRS